MSRLLIEPGLPSGAKFAAASDTTKLLYLLGLFYAAHALTDGFIPDAIARKLTHATRKQFDQAIEHLTSVQPGCDHPSWETRPGGWFIHDYDDPLYGNPMREDSEKRREQKVKAGIAGGKRSAIARAKKYGTAQPPSSNAEAEPEAPASKHPEAPPEAPASTSASTDATLPARSSPEAEPRARVSPRPHARNAHAEALPFPSSPDPSVTPDTSGVNETSGEHGDDAVLVGPNGAGDHPTSLRTEAVHLVDWLLVNRGDHTFGSREEQVRELATATAMLQLGLAYPQVLVKLQAYRAAMDPDDVASSLSFYYGRLQDDVHAELKQPRTPARSGTLFKAGDSIHDLSVPKGKH